MNTERRIFFGLLCFFAIGAMSVLVQLDQHLKDVQRIVLAAYRSEIAERESDIVSLENKIIDLITTDGYIVPEQDFLVFPFYPNDQIFVTSMFYLRGNPFQDNTGPVSPDESLHKAVDLTSLKNTIIRAPVSGLVVEHFPPPNGYWRGDGAFGGKIVIQDSNGVLHAQSHLSETYVSSIEGQNYVEAGDEIGRMGSTGKTTGGHLHYEIYEIDEMGVTTWYDPLLYFDIRVVENGQVLFPEKSIEELVITG